MPSSAKSISEFTVNSWFETRAIVFFAPNFFASMARVKFVFWDSVTAKKISALSMLISFKSFIDVASPFFVITSI